MNIRFFIVFQHSVGVKSGSIFHLLHIKPRLLILLEKKSSYVNTDFNTGKTETPCGPNSLVEERVPP